MSYESGKKYQAGKKNTDRILLLEQQLLAMAQMETLLKWSLDRCQAIPLTDDQMPEQEDLEKFESLTARFARFNDILVLNIFRLIDTIDLDDTGTVRDRINRAEKKGLIEDAQRFIEIRELRNSIAHEYQPEALRVIFPETLLATPILLDIAERVRKYCLRYKS